MCRLALTLLATDDRGSAYDGDVYGAQHHGPLLDRQIP